MSVDPNKQWRIESAANLKNLQLQFRRYTRWSEAWDHDHCEACGAKFAEYDDEDIQHEGYASCDDYMHGACYAWVCKNCFNDLKDDMGWAAVKE